MDTIELGRFEDTNQMFEKPDLTESLIHIKDYNYDDVIKTIVSELK